MKLEMFFEKFDQLTDSPGAVDKMRGLVLELAIRGRLSERDASDQADISWVLLCDELEAKSRSAQFTQKRIFEIPASWRWATLSDVGNTKPRNEAPDGTKCAFIPMRLIPSEYGRAPEHEKRIWEKIKTGYTHFSDGDVVMAKITPCFENGKSALVDNLPGGIGAGTTELHVFRKTSDAIDPSFILLYLKSPGFIERGIPRMTGSAGQKRVSPDYFSNSPFPLPPPAEQKRIVAKVDELMALCDRLEEQQYERVTRHAALTRAVVDRFNEEPTGDNLNLLFHKSYSISAADFRTAIVNLALRGKLAPRDEYAESVDLLLAKLQDERHRYATKYGFRTNDPRKDKANKPYSIPNHWRWVNLSDLFYAVTDGDHLPPPKSSDGIAFLTIGNITTGQLDFSEVRYVPKHYYDALAEYRQPRNGDFLYTVVGATYGRPAPVDTTRPFCVQRHIAILKPCQSTNRAFLSLLLKSPLVYEQATASTTGTAQPTIPLGALRRFRVPLPPLSEQDRIARRVSELIALVDAMDEQLRRTEATSEELLDAFTHLVLHPDKEIANNQKHDSASARAAIGCYVIRSLTQNASFGRTMLMKVFYLSEAHSGISQGWQPMRQAAGPYDPSIEDFESLGVQSGWFTVKTKTLGNGREMVQYQRESGIDAKIAEAVSVLGGQQTEFDRLLNLFQNKTTEEAEIIATLFAAWNDLLIDGKSPSDDEIIREVRENWHYRKERFTPTLLTRWLNWLRQQSVIPRGLAPRTRQQLKLGLS
jgi:type I restriction enzyme S subunit